MWKITVCENSLTEKIIENIDYNKIFIYKISVFYFKIKCTCKFALTVNAFLTCIKLGKNCIDPLKHC